MSRTRRISDPQLLRAISHPMRNRILAELSAVGPLRAADVAEQIGVPANQASFHLRQLAKYGLVEEAPELARDARDRVWRMLDESGLSFGFEEVERSPAGKAAVAVYRREAGAQAHELVESAFAAHEADDSHVMVSDHALRLTKDEVKEFGEALTELVDDTRRSTAGRGPERRTYRLLVILQPYDHEPEG